MKASLLLLINKIISEAEKEFIHSSLNKIINPNLKYRLIREKKVKEFPKVYARHLD
jgi:hypothetical protein